MVRGSRIRSAWSAEPADQRAHRDIIAACRALGDHPAVADDRDLLGELIRVLEVLGGGARRPSVVDEFAHHRPDPWPGREAPALGGREGFPGLSLSRPVFTVERVTTSSREQVKTRIYVPGGVVLRRQGRLWGAGLSVTAASASVSSRLQLPIACRARAVMVFAVRLRIGWAGSAAGAKSPGRDPGGHQKPGRVAVNRRGGDEPWDVGMAGEVAGDGGA